MADKRKAALWATRAAASAARKQLEKDRAKAQKQTAKRDTGKLKRPGRKPQNWEKLLYAGVSCLNLVLSLALMLLKRREIVLAVEQDEDVKLLLQEKAAPVTKKLE